MKIKIEIEVDTENPEDKEIVYQLIEALERFRSED